MTESETQVVATETDGPVEADAPGRISSYSTIWHLDHMRSDGLFSGPVVVQEKLDGSQFSAGILDGELAFRSRKAIINRVAVPDLFKGAVNAFEALHDDGKLVPGWVYRGEAICRPKHNTIKYDRAPNGGFVLFDIETRPGAFLSPGMVRGVAAGLGLEVVPTYFEGTTTRLDTLAMVDKWLGQGSLLGKSITPEGFVVKNYALFTPEKKIAMGKFVTSEFKEMHKSSWREQNPTRGDIVIRLVGELRNENRWKKAVQHGIEEGVIDPSNPSMRDMRYLAREVPADIRKEAEDYIRESLFNYFWPEMMRGAMRGLPEWYRSNYVPIPGTLAPETVSSTVQA